MRISSGLRAWIAGHGTLGEGLGTDTQRRRIRRHPCGGR